MEAEQLNVHVERSAELAVKKVFAILGVNVDEPREVEEFRENLRFGATLRRAADKGFLAMVVIIAGAVVAMAWAGIVAEFGPHK